MTIDVDAFLSGNEPDAGITVTPEEIDASIDKWAPRFGVDRDFARAIIKQESRGKAGAMSTVNFKPGARGLMQLMPDTAEELGVTDPFDTDQNIMGGLKYIKQQLDRYGGDKRKALAAYNAGFGSINKAIKRYGDAYMDSLHNVTGINSMTGKPNAEETRKYVKRIMADFEKRKVDVDAFLSGDSPDAGIKPEEFIDTPIGASEEVVPIDLPEASPMPVDSPQPAPVQPDGAPEQFSPDMVPQIDDVAPDIHEQRVEESLDDWIADTRVTPKQALSQKGKALAVSSLDKAAVKLYNLDRFLRSSRVKRVEEPLPEMKEGEELRIPGITEPASKVPPRPPEMEGKEWPIPEYTQDWSTPPTASKRLARWLRTQAPEWREEIAKHSDIKSNPINASFNLVAQQLPTLAQQVGLNAIPIVGPYLAISASMADETGSFLMACDDLSKGLSKEQVADWEEITNRYAGSYGALSGAIEYAGNAIGVLRGGVKPKPQDILKNPTAKAFILKYAKEIGGIVGEGIEEMLQGGEMNFFMRKAISEMKEKHPDFMPQWTPDDIIEQGLQGIIISGLTRGMIKSPSKISQIKQQRKDKIKAEAKKESDEFAAKDEVAKEQAMQEDLEAEPEKPFSTIPEMETQEDVAQEVSEVKAKSAPKIKAKKLDAGNYEVTRDGESIGIISKHSSGKGWVNNFDESKPYKTKKEAYNTLLESRPEGNKGAQYIQDQQDTKEAEPVTTDTKPITKKKSLAPEKTEEQPQTVEVGIQEDLYGTMNPKSQQDSKDNIRSSVHLSDETTWQKIVRNVQNNFARVNTLSKAFVEAGGKFTDATDLVGAEERFPGIAEAVVEDANAEHISPIAAKMKEYDISMKDMDDYLTAIHAPERNKQVASINKNLQDGGSGMSTQEAIDITNKIHASEKSAKFREIAGMVKAVNNKRMDLLVKEGLLSKELADKWRSTYKSYMPLRGFEEEDNYQLSQSFTGLEPKAKGRKLRITNPFRGGNKFSTSGEESKRAKGRKSRAANPLVNALSMYQNALVRVEKNKVGKTLYKFASENPDITTTIDGQTVPLFQIDKITSVPVIGKNGQVVYKRTKNGQDFTPEANQFSVKIDGEEHFITINDPLLHRAMTNLGVQKMGVITKYMAKYNRVMSMIHTGLNPPFMVSNFIRDFQTAGVYMTAEQSNKFARGVMRDTFPAMKGVWQGEGKKKSGEWTEWYERYRQAGGKIGFWGYSDYNTTLNKLKSELDPNWFQKAGSVRKLGQFIMKGNTAVENSLRLAAFKNAVKNGMTDEKAASLARNLTVNFNKRGEQQWINAAYLFSNATIQGNAKLMKTMATSPKLRKMATGFVVGQAFWANFMRTVGGEDESGEDYWDKIPDWVKERNFVIIDPKDPTKYTTIPMPYGLNIFAVLGNSIESVINNPSKKNLGSEAKNLVLGSISTFNPLGAQESDSFLKGLVKNVMPSIGTPIVEHLFNENFAGTPIRPKDYPGEITPDHKKYFSSARESSKQITKGLSDATTGKGSRGGWIDISPETLDHLMDSYAGGLGKTIENSIEVIFNSLTGRQTNTRNIPLIRRFRGQLLEGFDTSDFYDYKDELAPYLKDESLIRRSGSKDDRKKLALAKKAKSTENRLNAISKKWERRPDTEENRIAAKKEKDRESLRFKKQYRRVMGIK